MTERRYFDARVIREVVGPDWTRPDDSLEEMNTRGIDDGKGLKDMAVAVIQSTE